MATTLFELKEKMAVLADAIRADAEWIAEKAANPETPMLEIDEKQKHRDEIKKRYDMLKAQHDDMEATQKASVAQKASNDPKTEFLKAKGEFYKTALMGGDVNSVLKAYSGLGAIPSGDADLGTGDNLLPTNLVSDLIMEPLETNSLRTIEPISNITGLEEPKLNFVIEDSDLEDVTDKDTAREIAMGADTVSYGRYKTKVSATVKDTVLHGAVVDIAATVENALRSGLAIKEKMRAFNPNPDDAHAHMSFYSSKNAIKTVYGATTLEAIINAYGDLADFYAENATCVMRRSDYTAMIAALANGSESLFGKKPEEIIGIPVVFNDRAVVPIVGDFRYSKQNYDLGTIYDTDKDVKKGEYYFVVTAWGDHQIKLKSAFRLAAIGQAPTLTSVSIAGTPKVGTTLSISCTYSSGAPSPTLAYQWKRANTASGSYTDIAGAMYATYAPTADDVGKFLKVQVTASGSAVGVALSQATAAVTE